MPTEVSCAGGIVFDDNGRLLLVERGRPPSAGSWSIPGGRCEDGETAEQTCVRELAEETGLAVVVLYRAGRAQRDGPGDVVYVIDDFVCAPLSSRGVDSSARDDSLVAGDDAAAARWVTRGEFERLPLTPLLAQTLREWDCLPRG